MIKVRNKGSVSSPFKVGGKVEPPYFVGREEELKTLVDDAKRLSQNNVIIAPRRYGKTSLLHNVKIQVEKETDILVVEINCREMDSLENFYRVTIGEILRNYEKKHKVRGLLITFEKIFYEKIVETLKIIQEIGGSLGRVGEFYLKFREKSIEEKDLARATFDFIKIFSEEKKQNMIIIFDEFQKTDSFNGILYELFKSDMDSQKRVKYYFSGSSLGLLEKVFLRPNSPLYLMAGKHYMEPLQERVVLKFVKNRFKSSKLQITNDSAKLFYAYTGGIPFYVQKMGILCFHQAIVKKCKGITQDLVNKSWQDMLDEFDGEFESRLTTRFSDQQRGIIKAVAALGPVTLTGIAKKLGNKSTDISSAVRRLVSAMILHKDKQGRYTLTDEVFRRWLSKGKLL